VTKIGRNDICPCGSGKKYKKCCLANEEAAAGTRREERSAAPRVLDWLHTHYREELQQAVENDFFGLDNEELERLMELGPEYHNMIDMNIGEWSLTEAQIMVGKKLTPVRTLVLGPGGPLLPAPARQWMQHLVERPMSLYEVRRSEPGSGLELADMLRPDEPPVWVEERTASRSLVRWDVIGARLMRRDEGWILSGALYPYTRPLAAECREEILEEMEGVAWESDLGREVVSTSIIGYWLNHLIDEHPLPELVDVSTGEPILLVTEHYRVTNWFALATALAARPDVEGDRENGWVKFEELEKEERRSLATIEAVEPDSLEVFCRTLKLADAAREWLEEVAGKALTHKGREVVDPRSPQALGSAKAPARPGIPPELQLQLVREMLTRHYETWPDTALPALGGKTPTEAVATPEGREAVAELLKEFDQSEARRAGEEGGEPFDFGFLRKRLGLGE